MVQWRNNEENSKKPSFNENSNKENLIPDQIKKGLQTKVLKIEKDKKHLTLLKTNTREKSAKN